MINFKKIVLMGIVCLYLIALNPIGANAEWKNDSNGWWNTEGNSWSIGWRQIDGNWYYFYSNGYMAHNTTIDGYTLDSNGAWSLTQESQESSENPMHKALDPDSSYFDAESQRNMSENN